VDQVAQDVARRPLVRAFARLEPWIRQTHEQRGPINVMCSA
jgi:hypothetical protein